MLMYLEFSFLVLFCLGDVRRGGFYSHFTFSKIQALVEKAKVLAPVEHQSHCGHRDLERSLDDTIFPKRKIV